MKYIEGTPRNQILLFTQTIDEMIETDNPARFIDAYVDQIDLVKLGFRMAENSTGRPPFHQGLMVKIYIYSYLNRIRTSRRIEKELLRNIEMKWLTGGLAPDFHTIAEFRRINHKAMRALFRDFLRLCHKLELVSLETVGIDGTKLRAQNNINNIFRRDTVDGVIRKIDEKIDEYLKELDEGDATERLIELDRDKVAERVRHLKRQREKAEAAKELFAAGEGNGTVFATDADARMMSDKGKIRPGYNAQTAVDGKHRLIVANDVTNEANDQHQMTPMLGKLSEIKEEENMTTRTTALMDCGYHTEENIMAHRDDKSFEVIAPSPKDSPKEQKKKSVPKKEFRAEKFQYDAMRDVCVCPQGEELQRLTETTVDGKRAMIYQCRTCNGCVCRDRCTRNEKGRTVTITENHEAMEAYRKAMKIPESVRKINERKTLCEHPFGTMKRNFGFDYVLMRGIEKAKSEFGFMCFIYNLKRCLSIIGFAGLVAALNTEQ